MREYRARATGSVALAAIRGLFRFLVSERHLKVDPTENLENPKLWSNLPKSMQPEEVEALLAAPDRATPDGLRDAADRPAELWAAEVTPKESEAAPAEVEAPAPGTDETEVLEVEPTEGDVQAPPAEDSAAAEAEPAEAEPAEDADKG